VKIDEVISPRWAPTQADTLALKAALHPDGDIARQALDAWCDLRRRSPDAGNNRIFALLCARSRHENWSRVELEVARATALARSALSSMVQREAMTAVQILVENDLTPIALKGVALQATAYVQPSLRPIGDVDVLVPYDQAQKAVRILIADGWICQAKQWFGPGRFASYAGMNFMKGRFGNIDLHWRISLWSRDPTQPQRMLNRAVPLQLGCNTIAALCPTDNLFHTIIHGVAWEKGPNVQWVPDACALLERGQMNWTQFVDELDRSGFVPPAIEALHFLREQLGQNIPSDTLRQLYAKRVRMTDRLTHWVRTKPPSKTRMLTRLLVTDFAHRTIGESVPKRIMGYPMYVLRTIANEEPNLLRGLLNGAQRNRLG
jgi:Uncharacterised nucleotidyltransferase